MRKTLTILIIFLSSSHFGTTQTIFNYGPEQGLSFTQLPRVHYYPLMTDHVMETTVPLMSPLLGFHGQLLLIKHFLFTIGLQYQLSGQYYHYHRDGRIPRVDSIPVFYTYTYDKWEQQIFHKLALPISLGYAFKCRGIQSSVFIGFRPNLFLTGRYNYRSINNATDNTKDKTMSHGYNPVEAGEPVNRLNNQFLLGFSVTAGQHLLFKFNLNRGYTLYYSEYKQLGWEPYYTYFNNSDFGLSVTYLLRPMKKNN